MHGDYKGQLGDYYKQNNIRFLYSDFTDPNSFRVSLENDYDDVYMLASMIGVNNTLEPHEIIRVNITQNLQYT